MSSPPTYEQSATYPPMPQQQQGGEPQYNPGYPSPVPPPGAVAYPPQPYPANAYPANAYPPAPGGYPPQAYGAPSYGPAYAPGYPQQQIQYAAQPGQMYSPVMQTTVVVNRQPGQDDFFPSLLIFIIGWFGICCVWLGGFAYIKSPNASAKGLAYASVIMYFLALVILLTDYSATIGWTIWIIYIIAISAAASSDSNYNNYNNYTTN